MNLKKSMVWPVLTAVLLMGGAFTSLAATRLETVTDVWWNDDNITFGEWEPVEDAYQYEINLYCNDSRIDTFKTKKEKYDMEKKMTKEGEYTFRVRALAKESDRDLRDGYWSDYSDGIYIDAAFAELIKNGGKIDTETSGPGAKEQASNPTPAVSVVYPAKWIQDKTGWWYQRTDGTYPAAQWFQDPANGKWYYFDGNGYMMTGWIQLEGKQYYCGPDGAMFTGACTIDDVAYQFDGSGALIGTR